MRYITIVFSVIFLFSCKKDETKEVSKVPEITFISVSSNTVKQFKDSLDIVVSYSDGNGDLGDIDPDENSIEVLDSRLTKPDYYHLKPIAPDNANVHITGELRIKVKNLFVLGTGNSETINLKIKIKDRANNWSNEVSTSAITIIK